MIRVLLTLKKGNMIPSRLSQFVKSSGLIIIKFMGQMWQGERKTSDAYPIYVDFINHKWGDTSAKLGITFAPGKRQTEGWTSFWHRDLKQDLDRIKQQYQIDTIVCMLEEQEMKNLQIANELEECHSRGIKTYHFPIKDHHIPEDEQKFKSTVAEVVDKELRNGKKVAVHCYGGVGRAPTFATSCLIYSGIDSSTAIDMVRSVRKNSLRNIWQLRFINRLNFS